MLDFPLKPFWNQRSDNTDTKNEKWIKSNKRLFVHSHEASTCERRTNKMSVSFNRWEKNCYVSNVIHIVCFHWSFKLFYFLFFIVALKDDLNRLKASMRRFIFGIWCIQWVYQWIYSLLYQKLINKYIYGFDNHEINEIKKKRTYTNKMNELQCWLWNEINCVISTSCI